MYLLIIWTMKDASTTIQPQPPSGGGVKLCDSYLVGVCTPFPFLGLFMASWDIFGTLCFTYKYINLRSTSINTIISLCILNMIRIVIKICYSFLWSLSVYRGTVYSLLLSKTKMQWKRMRERQMGFYLWSWTIFFKLIYGLVLLCWIWRVFFGIEAFYLNVFFYLKQKDFSKLPVRCGYLYFGKTLIVYLIHYSFNANHLDRLNAK